MERKPIEGLPKPQSLAPCNARSAGLWLFRRLCRFRVAGSSMEPTLLAGQSVLVDPRAYLHSPPQAGDVVLLLHPLDPGMLMVKRVGSVERGKVFVLGDNSVASTDSRTFG
ncbi:MAG: nickel-type superoxide dismutase maturation protease, partial [Planctomycetota bacterium]|nr:nickel-type superoxide dismutase maturation protease [Planctomycetota bacterium]